MEPVIADPSMARNVQFRFDYKQRADGTTVTEGTVFRLASDWLFDHSPYSPLDIQDVETAKEEPSGEELDYALVRLEGSPGGTPVGGEWTERTATARGWIPLPTRPHSLVPGTPLFILQHPLGGPLKIGMDMEGIIGTSTNGTRVRYHISTEPGSGGAPCFDAGWVSSRARRRSRR